MRVRLLLDVDVKILGDTSNTDEPGIDEADIDLKPLGRAIAARVADMDDVTIATLARETSAFEHIRSARFVRAMQLPDPPHEPAQPRLDL